MCVTSRKVQCKFTTKHIFSECAYMDMQRPAINDMETMIIRASWFLHIVQAGDI